MKTDVGAFGASSRVLEHVKFEDLQVFEFALVYYILLHDFDVFEWS